MEGETSRALKGAQGRQWSGNRCVTLMNFINRILVSLGALGLVLAGVYILLLISDTVRPGEFNGDFFVPQIERIATDTGANLWTDVGIAVVFMVAGIALLIVQIASARGGQVAGAVLLRDDEIGSVWISVKSIRALSERTTYGVRSVRGSRVTVRVTPSGLHLICNLTLRMATDLPTATEDVQKIVHEVVERLTGLKVNEVSVKARYGRERDEPVLAK